MKYICPCCGYLTFEYPDDWKINYDGNKFPTEYAQYACGVTHDSCPICSWEDDGTLINNTFDTGANLPLSVSQENYIKCGDSSGTINPFSHKPTSSDVLIGPLTKFDDYDI